jgi:hypothetical protein
MPGEMPGFLWPMQDRDHKATDAEDEALEAAEEGGEAPSIESEARAQGWAPREEYRGDPQDWVPAEEYVRMGDPKYLRKALKDTRRAVSKLEETIAQKDAEFGERLARFERMSKAQRAKLYSDIEAARRQAVKDGDEERYDELNRAEASLYEQEEAAAKPAPKATERQPSEPHPDVERWVQANPWFVKDKALNRVAQGIHEELMDTEPHLSIEENLARTRAEVIKRFPERFGRGSKPQAGGGHSAVESGARAPAAKGGKDWSAIPAEDRAIMKRHIEEGLYKDQAEAARVYWS